MLERHIIYYKYGLHILVSVHLMTSQGINMEAGKSLHVITNFRG